MASFGKYANRHHFNGTAYYSLLRGYLPYQGFCGNQNQTCPLPAMGIII